MSNVLMTKNGERITYTVYGTEVFEGDRVRIKWPDGSMSDHPLHGKSRLYLYINYHQMRVAVPLGGLEVMCLL